MNNYLYHHGVKGQKWGVRKDRSATQTEAKKKRSLSPKAKRVLKKSAIVAGSLAVGIIISRNQAALANKLYSYEVNSKKHKREIEKLLSDMGPVIVNNKTGKVVDGYVDSSGSFKNYSMDDLKSLDLY